MAERLHRCDHCSKAFTQKYNLKVHLRIHAEDRPFVCGSCGKAFTQLGNLHVHEATHLGLQPHACPHCPFRTGLVSSLRKHIGRKHVKETVRRHVRKEDSTDETIEKDEIECDVCHVLFTSLPAFERHRKSHPHMQPDRRYLCPECDYSTDDRTQLGNHLLTHSGEKPHRCDLCGKAFSLKSYLKVHLRHHTGERPFVCDVCGKGFTRKDSLRAHERTHSGEKPYLCGVCGKNFTSLSGLQVHTMSHTMKKIYPNLLKRSRTLEEVEHVCSFCSAGFPSPSELQSHVNEVHSIEEKKETDDVAKKEKEAFVCDVCNVLVSSLSALEGHKKSHRQPNQKRRRTECDDATQPDPNLLAHKCSLCGKAFTRKGHLKRHIETHLGESPHACNTCGKRFTRVDNMRKHEKTHTKVLISS